MSADEHKKEKGGAEPKKPGLPKKPYLQAGALAACACAILFYASASTHFFSLIYDTASAGGSNKAQQPPPSLPQPMTPQEKLVYNEKMRALAHLPRSNLTPLAVSSSTLALELASSSASTSKTLWPPTTVYPDQGALLPFNRIVAYYGNFYSKQMGVLGEYPVPQMLAMLASTTEEWREADPSTPVVPAIDYIAVTAQAAPGADGKYRARMPDSQIQKALDLANQIHGVLILDVQVGLSNVETEVPLLEKWLKLPNVELALDPEFAMHDGEKPGDYIGSLDASDINFAAKYLARLADENHLPPKILIVHRFTEGMVTNAEDIKPLPEVEVVMDMDGWGPAYRKIGTYDYFIASEPVQFTGFKLFYKNDLKPPSTGLMTPQEILNLTPSPSFIQYQ